MKIVIKTTNGTARISKKAFAISQLAIRFA